jgi:hypothetical protein
MREIKKRSEEKMLYSCLVWPLGIETTQINSPIEDSKLSTFIQFK